MRPKDFDSELGAAMEVESTEAIEPGPTPRTGRWRWRWRGAVAVTKRGVGRLVELEESIVVESVSEIGLEWVARFLIVGEAARASWVSQQLPGVVG